MNDSCKRLGVSRMRPVLYGIAAVTALLLVLSRVRTGDEIVPELIILNLEGLPFLEEVLKQDAAAANTLERYLENLPLWKITVDEATAPEGSTRFKIFFDFGLPERNTTRILRRGYILERDDGTGLYSIIASSEAYQTLTLERTQPAISRVLGLEVFRKALANEVFIDSVSAWFREDPAAAIRQMTLVPAPDTSTYEFKLGLHRGGLAGEAGVESRYWLIDFSTAMTEFTITGEDQL